MKCKNDNCNNEGRLKTKSSTCPKCNSREWRQKNPERDKELNLANYYRHRDKILVYNKTDKVRKSKVKWHHDNKERRRDKLNSIHYKQNRTIGRRYAALKNGAKRRNYEVTFSKIEYENLLKNSKCYYCNGKLNETGSGLDRLNNDIGYTLQNVVNCCKNCNWLKGDLLSSEEMLEIIKILKQMRKKDNIWE